MRKQFVRWLELAVANELSMVELDWIERLRKSGASCREIVRLLRLDRQTVRKYVARLENPTRLPVLTLAPRPPRFRSPALRAPPALRAIPAAHRGGPGARALGGRIYQVREHTFAINR